MKTDVPALNIIPCSYVYRLENQSTGEFYIGFRSANKVPPEQDLGYKYFSSSKYVKNRFNEFNAVILAEFFDKDAAYAFEQELIFEAWGTLGLLNKCHHHGKKAWNTAGMKRPPFSDEHKRKMSEAKMGKPMAPVSAETRKKLSDAAQGRLPISDETRKKMSDTRKDVPCSDEHRKKISDAKMGYIVSDDTKLKMSAAKMGRKRVPFSDETKMKMSDSAKARAAISC